MNIFPKTVALPRNFLHVNLLIDNEPNVELVIYRDAYFHDVLEKKFPGRTLYLGREQRLGINGWNLPKIYSYNSSYYKKLEQTIKSIDPSRFIIFLENEPLEVFLMDTFGIEKFELWEEGVMHYVDMFNPFTFRLRRAAQILLGYYSGHPLRTRVDRNKIIVKDRFDKKNIHLKTPIGTEKPRDGIAFLSNVLVEDGHISRKNYINTIGKLVLESPFPIYYLPHPRESKDLTKELENTLGGEKFVVVRETGGSIQHCVDYDYKAYISPFSTTLLDLNKFDKSYWVPGIFNLTSYQRALSNTDKFPIKAVSSTKLLFDELTKSFRTSS